MPQTPAPRAAQVHHITHPLVQHKLTLMRDREASSTTFRTLLGELAMLMAYEVTRDMPTQMVEIETPLEKMASPMIDGKKLVFASILPMPVQRPYPPGWVAPLPRWASRVRCADRDR